MFIPSGDQRTLPGSVLLPSADSVLGPLQTRLHLSGSFSMFHSAPHSAAITFWWFKPPIEMSSDKQRRFGPRFLRQWYDPTIYLNL